MSGKQKQASLNLADVRGFSLNNFDVIIYGLWVIKFFKQRDLRDDGKRCPLFDNISG